MHSFKSIVGRLFLFLSVPVFAYVAFRLFMLSINKMNDPTIGWFNFADETARSFMIIFIAGIAAVIILLSAIVVGVRREFNLLCVIASIIGVLLALAFVAFVMMLLNAMFGPLEEISGLTRMLAIAAPLLYITGGAFSAFSALESELLL